MQIICKVKKPSVSISSKLNVALVEAACSKSRPPRVMTAQLASASTLGELDSGHAPFHSIPRAGSFRHEDFTISRTVNFDASEGMEEAKHPPFLKDDGRQD